MRTQTPPADGSLLTESSSMLTLGTHQLAHDHRRGSGPQQMASRPGEAGAVAIDQVTAVRQQAHEQHCCQQTCFSALEDVDAAAVGGLGPPGTLQSAKRFRQLVRFGQRDARRPLARGTLSSSRKRTSRCAARRRDQPARCSLYFS